jgi:exodeoxyribonuclease VIII
MTEKEYRQHPAISRSELWRMHESPEKFKYFKEHPPEPTPSLLFGQVVHKLLLQPEDFESEFVIVPNVDGRTRAGKEALKLIENTDGRTRVKYDMYETASLMVEKSMSEPLVRKLLAGQKEQPFFWTDADTGEQCKCRTDCLTWLDGDELPTVVDYKTTTNAKTDVFNNEIFKLGYHFQSAMYCEGVRKSLNLPERPGFTFIVQEKTAPYSLNIIEVTPDVMNYGVDVFREMLGIFHTCKETGYYYGYTGVFNEPNETVLPGWLNLGVDEDSKEQ